jgi:hypothetical protein
VDRSDWLSDDHLDLYSGRAQFASRPGHLVSWGGVRLSPLGTSATVWPIVPAPDDK